MALFNKRSNAGVGVVIALCAGFAAPAVADEAIIDSLLDCRAKSAAEERASCYDAIVDALAAPVTPTTAVEASKAAPTQAQPTEARSTEAEPAVAPAATPPAAVAATASSPASKTAEDTFGLPPEVAADRPEEIELTIARLSRTASGKLALTATNGQVWRQTTSSSLRLDTGDVVTIRRGTLGSHKLTKAGTNRSMKVKRVK